MPDLNSVDAFIQSAADGFTQVYQTVRPPAVVAPSVTPLVYATSAPAGGSAIGFDLDAVVLVAVIVLVAWAVLKR